VQTRPENAVSLHNNDLFVWKLAFVGPVPLTDKYIDADLSVVIMDAD
jgi:hypothetical protein